MRKINYNNSKFIVSTPDDLKADDKDLIEGFIRKFENEFNNQEKEHEYYHLVINFDVPERICNEIATIYRFAGWGKVKCNSSSKKGETHGLTGLQLWVKNPELKD